MEKCKRILHVLGGLQRGGAETLVMNLYRRIDREKIQFDFVIHTSDKAAYYDEIIDLGGKIYVCPQYKVYNHFKYKKWWKNFLVNHPEYTIVHGHVRSTASIYLKITRKLKRYAIAHSHSTSSGKGLRGIIKNILQHGIRRNADYFMGCSNEANEWLFGKKVARNKEKCEVLKNGIDTNTFAYNRKIECDMRKKLGIENKFVVGTVGRIEEPKNPMFIVEVFSEIYKRNDNAVFLWVGDGSLMEQVKNKCRELNVIDNFIFVGSKSNVSDYLQTMNVFLFPSLWEGFGISLIEAQAVGMPCVVSNTIVKEAFVTDLLDVVNLNEPSAIWAETCLNHVNKENKITKKKIEERGLDIHDITKKLEEKYMSIR